MCTDRTVQQRKSFKKLLDQLKEKRESEPNKTYYIRNNIIVSFDKNMSDSFG